MWVLRSIIQFFMLSVIYPLQALFRGHSIMQTIVDGSRTDARIK
ncbi:hypothetical protein AM1_F0083 (plasmid) [Acaryochloris marina MBIC11017]|uniref:Uncharacterized protein n=1 Tax=Acaryochloris marina (strain MBIC 11017) TaxID=329726 RepID=A8ZQ64_ACAM1|nr:hypothetical protein AM1_F0083 [Acaryochloris marina MBIC11017]